MSWLARSGSLGGASETNVAAETVVTTERSTLHDNLTAGLDKPAVPRIVGRQYDLVSRRS